MAMNGKRVSRGRLQPGGVLVEGPSRDGALSAWEA